MNISKYTGLSEQELEAIGSVIDVGRDAAVGPYQVLEIARKEGADPEGLNKLSLLFTLALCEEKMGEKKFKGDILELAGVIDIKGGE